MSSELKIVNIFSCTSFSTIAQTFHAHTKTKLIKLQSSESLLRSSQVSPILSNDAKTQGKLMLDTHPLRSLEERGWGASRRSASSSSMTTRHEQQPRRPHLVLKRAKLGNGPTLSQKRIPKRSELVFLDSSPNYCEPDLAQGSLGTQGRYCNRTSRGQYFLYN